jgi:hypothetical protein
MDKGDFWVMKNRSFASLKLILYNFLAPIGIILLPLIYTLFLTIISEHNYTGIILLLYVFLWLVFYFSTCHNAFQIVTIDSIGVHNKFTSIKWSEINKVKLIDVELYKYTFPKPIVIDDIMVIGNVKEGGFSMQNKKESVIISLTQKNKLLLQKYCRNSIVLDLI